MKELCVAAFFHFQAVLMCDRSLHFKKGVQNNNFKTLNEYRNWKVTLHWRITVLHFMAPYRFYCLVHCLPLSGLPCISFLRVTPCIGAWAINLWGQRVNNLEESVRGWSIPCTSLNP